MINELLLIKLILFAVKLQRSQLINIKKKAYSRDQDVTRGDLLAEIKLFFDTLLMKKIGCYCYLPKLGYFGGPF